MNVWSEIHTFICFVNWYIWWLPTILKWLGALRFSFLVGYGLYACCNWFFGAICCHYYFYENGNDWEDLLNYFEIVLPYTTIEKWSFLSVNFFITVWRIDVQIKTCFLPWRVSSKHEYMMYILSLVEMSIYI